MTITLPILHRAIAVGNKTDIQQLARSVAREVFAADDLKEAHDIIETIKPELIILDHAKHIPVYINKFLNTIGGNLEINIVVVGKDNDDHSAVEYTQIGACDYINQNNACAQLQQIAKKIKNKLNTNSESVQQKDYFTNELAISAAMAGKSDAIIDVLRTINLVANSRCNPILIVGETGTGKELAAKAVHAKRHPNKPFVAINCAALTANLLESELFGHVKGSFTGADREKTGLLELAQEGTIFLDEISEMPMDLQAKLLRVLQEKTFRKVGGIQDITCNATIIASTNRELLKQVHQNQFRRDLYYRLSIFPVGLAPLRSNQRKKDIPLLAEYFLSTSKICPEKTNKITAITKFAMEALQNHHWPGNVRELRNVIERAILLEQTDKISLNSIIINPTDSVHHTNIGQSSRVKDFSLEKAERELIAKALHETGWQKTRAAALLGITRATLYAKVKQHDIKKDLPSASKTDTQTLPADRETVSVA